MDNKYKPRRRKGRGFNNNYENSRNRNRSKELKNRVPLMSKEGWILFVTNLHEEITEDEVRDVFADYGFIKNLHLNLNRRTGFVKGYALVEYNSQEEAQRAKEELNNSELLKLTINVDWCFVKFSH